MHGYLRALRYFRPDGRLISLLLVLVLASIGLGLLQAWPTAILIDSILTTTPHNDWIHRLFLAPLPHGRLAQVIGITLIGMFMKITQDTIWMFRMMINYRIKYNGVARVREELYNKLQDLGPAYHQMRPQGDSIYRLSTDAWGFFGILDTVVATSIAVVMPIFMGGIMFSRNVKLTIFALSVTPLLIAINIYFGRAIRARAAASKQIDGELTTTIQRSMSSISLITAFGRQFREAIRFKSANDRSNAGLMRLNWKEQLYPLCVNTVYSLGGAIIFGYGGYLVWSQQFAHPISNPLTCGDLMVFMSYLGSLWEPLRCLTGFSANIQGYAAATDRVFDVLDRATPTPDAADPVSLAPAKRVLSLDNVAFSYSDSEPVLTGINAQILPGQMVAFVGSSGAGKSTLTNLLSRLYDPTSGAVRLDGVDIRQVRRTDLHHHIALVQQESPLLAASIAENIAYGRPGASRDDIRNAAALSGADEFINRLPDGYDTLVADGGQNFSGGQRQRIAIARAILTGAPVLILDEPTSAQDPLHEQHIMATLRRLKGTRTVVVVTHRLETIASSDQIFVMSHGRIVEHGTHESLIAADGVYASMAKTVRPPDDDRVFRAA